VAKALYQHTDELVVLIARAITRRWWSAPLMLGSRRRGAASRSRARERSTANRADDVGGCLQCPALQWHSAKR